MSRLDHAVNLSNDVERLREHLEDAVMAQTLLLHSIHRAWPHPVTVRRRIEISDCPHCVKLYDNEKAHGPEPHTVIETRINGRHHRHGVWPDPVTP